MSDFEDALKAGKELAAAKLNIETQDLKGHPFAWVPINQFVRMDMADLLPNPLRKKANATFKAAHSFSEYIADFNTGDTKLFGNQDGNAIVARIDYHGDKPSWCDHTATLTLKYSPEWIAWTGINNKQTPQVQFAEFLEQHELDVIEPATAEVMDAVIDLQAKRSVNFRKAVDLTSGRVQLLFEDQEEGKGKGEIKLPKELTLSLAVYDFSEPVQIVAKLRYRISDEGKLSFIVALVRPHKAVDMAFEAVVKDVESDTGLTVLHGSVSVG